MSYAIFCYSLDVSLPKYEYLSFDRELFSNNITGKIPTELGSLRNLVSLKLNLNKNMEFFNFQNTNPLRVLANVFLCEIMIIF